MRISWLLKHPPVPICLDQDATVGTLREKLQEHFDHALKDHGQKGGADVRLYYNDVCLADDGQALQEAGVGEGAVVRVLSTALAKHHGRRGKTRCLRAGIEALPAGETREAEVLRLSRPFPLTCSVFDLAELGAGWPLFFDLTRSLGLLLCLVFLVNLPAVVLYGRAGDGGLSSWLERSENHEMMLDHYYLSAGNLGPDGSDSIVPGLCVLVSTLLLLFASMCYSGRQRRIKMRVDDAEVEPHDFGLLIRGLPEDATDEGEITRFLEANARRRKHTEVVSVVVGYRAEDYRPLLRAREAAEKALHGARGEEARERLAGELREASAPFATVEALRSRLRGTGCAIAVLRYEAEHRECIVEWGAMRWPRCPWKQRAPPLFRGKHAVRISRARDPTSVIWANLGIPVPERLRAAVLVYTCLGAFFVICLMSFRLLDALEVWMEGSRWFSQLFAAVFLTINSLIHLIVPYFVEKERFSTRTKAETAIMLKVAVFQVTTYFVCPMVVFREPDDWYSDGGLVPFMAWLLLAQGVLGSLGNAIGVRNVLHYVIRRSVKIDTPGLLQVEYQKFFEAPMVSNVLPTAKVLRLFFMGIAFTPMVPISGPIAALGLMLEYWAQKYRLLRHSRRPYRQSHEVAYAALQFVNVSLAVQAALQYVFLRPSLYGVGEELSMYSAWALIVIALCIFLTPYRKLERLWRTFLHSQAATNMAEDNSVQPRMSHPGLGEGGEKANDYYEVQARWGKHQKYHTAVENEVYLRFEAIMRHTPASPTVAMTSAVKQWDFGTGNFSKPRSATKPPEPEPPEPTAAAPGAAAEEDEGEAARRPSRPTVGTAVPILVDMDMDDMSGLGSRSQSADGESDLYSDWDPTSIAITELMHRSPSGSSIPSFLPGGSFRTPTPTTPTPLTACQIQ